MRTEFRRFNSPLALAISAALGLCFSASKAQETRQPPAGPWEKEIRAFEAADRTNPPPKGSVVFIGSSSIACWANVAQAFPGHNVLNRGFGGSQLCDSVAYADRIVIPYQPKLVLLYAGDNDLAAGKPPERVLADFKAFVEKVRSALPASRIGYISIKPCPAREHLLDQVKAANQLVREYAALDDHLLFVDVFTPMLNKNGQPRAELYLSGGLHPNAQGYKVWASLLGPIVDRYDRR
jgi:lysophospholipase L1-like esterase